MSLSEAHSATDARSGPRATRWLAWSPLVLVSLLCLVSSAGCRGCLRNDSDRLSREELEKKAKEQKDALVTSPLLTLPADTEIKIAAAKPGHWVETVRQVKSNREDLQVVATGDVLRGPDKVLNLANTNVTAEFARTTVLPKGQTKTIDLQYFVPTTTVAVDPLNPVPTALRLRSSLLSRSLLTPLTQEPFATAELSNAEFLMTVLSPKPQEYAFLSATDMVMWRGMDQMVEDRTRSYRVILCGSKDGKVDFPTSMLTMTAVAVLVWDDLAPDDLSEDQKTAILDWLHWGGQIVISGPGSWSQLQNSFLSPYLPVQSAESRELSTQDLAALNYWVVPDMADQPQEPLRIVGADIPGLRMELADQSQWLPQAEQLVAERMIGRGRIVVTGFPLRDQRLYRWKYFSSFFSTGLLRRPARVVSKTGSDSLVQLWAEPFLGQEKYPLLNSRLRIASRDMPLPTSSEGAAAQFAQRSEEELQRRANPRNIFLAEEPAPPAPRSFGSSELEYAQWGVNGSAWSDTSGISFGALNCLRSAAGIVLPTRTTILTLIGSYLVILVPLNWLIFRLLGRLEWAWVVAPILAIVGVLVVTRVARLDIGFARRTTEIGLLEMQGEYPRGHVTNYCALYTSLSTPYSLEFPERGSVALPFGNVMHSSRRSGNATQVVQARYGTSPGIRLEPVTVYSNSLEILHSEQIVGFPGGILYGIPDTNAPTVAALKNATGLQLKSCCLLRKSKERGIEFAWMGDMLDDNSRTARFVPGSLDAPWPYWNRSPITRRPNARPGDQPNKQPNNDLINPSDDQPSNQSGNPATEEVTDEVQANELLVGELLVELVNRVPLVNGQVRLLGYTDDRPGRMETKPDDGRLDTRCLIMVHLQPAAWEAMTRDQQVIGRLPNVQELPEDKEEPPEL